MPIVHDDQRVQKIIHYLEDGISACGKRPSEFPVGHSYTTKNEGKNPTCPACLKVLTTRTAEQTGEVEGEE